jgi:hypothetical protein
LCSTNINWFTISSGITSTIFLTFGFSVGPSSADRGGASFSRVDWSRSARKRRKLEVAAAEPQQSKITDYLGVIDKITALAKENQKLSFILQSLTPASSFTCSSPTTDKITPILKNLIANASNNIGKSDKQRRHSLVLKKFSTLLLINAGSMTYDFIHRNMPEALPSLRTVQTIIRSDYQPFREGYFRFNEVVEHLHKHQAPFIVTVAEDATRIIKTVDYDAYTNTCVGFVLPNDDKGMPIMDSFTVSSFQDIESYFLSETIAKYAYIFTVQPLKEGAPSFCLGCIGTNNKFTAHDVLNRWRYIQSELSTRGVTVINFASDGDPRLLKAMRLLSQFTPNDLSLSLNYNASPTYTYDKQMALHKAIFPLLRSRHGAHRCKIEK